MKRLKPNANSGASFFPYVLPTEFGGETIEVSAIQSVTWSLYEPDGTAVVEDQSIGACDAEGRWVANITPTYTTLTGTANETRIVVFTVTFAGNIGGTNYTDLVAKFYAQFTIQYLPS